MKKFLLPAAILFSAFTVFSIGCGNVDLGITLPGTMKGTQVVDELYNATLEGLMLCALRTGITPPIPYEKNGIADYYGINETRYYKVKDVAACKDLVKISVALNSSCPTNIYGVNCYLTPTK